MKWKKDQAICRRSSNGDDDETLGSDPISPEPMKLENTAIIQPSSSLTNDDKPEKTKYESNLGFGRPLCTDTNMDISHQNSTVKLSLCVTEALENLSQTSLSGELQKNSNTSNTCLQKIGRSRKTIHDQGPPRFSSASNISQLTF